MPTILHRRGTAAQWTSANPVLASGEPGFETDTGKEKRGNGTSPWNALEYFARMSDLNAVSAGAIPDATEAVKGKAALATQALTDAGVNDDRIVTPLKLWTRLSNYAQAKHANLTALSAFTTSSNAALGTSDTVLPTQGAVKAYADSVSAGGTDKVSGPASALSGSLASFSGTTGKLIQDTGASISVDGTLALNSDTKVPTEKAIRTYVAATTYTKAETVSTTSTASSATPTPVAGARRTLFRLTAQAVTAAFANPTGAATDGNSLIITIIDNGTARALSWGTEYVDQGPGLPTTTVAGKLMHLGFIRNAGTSKWDLIAKTVGP